MHDFALLILLSKTRTGGDTFGMEVTRLGCVIWTDMFTRTRHAGTGVPNMGDNREGDRF